jgi:two-component system nitrogen regulation sensor histidine kinase NtrY
VALIVAVSLLLYALLESAGQSLTLPDWLTRTLALPQGTLTLPAWLARLLAFGVTLSLALWTVARFLRPLTQTLADLSDGIRSFSDRDFSVRVATVRRDELGELVRLFNRVGDILQEERGQIRQRELLLQTALDQSPIAVILVNPLDRVIYANLEARRLLLGGGRLVGMSFRDVLAGCPEGMRTVLEGEADGIFTVPADERPETYHAARRGFLLNRQPHALYLLRRMTVELSRQEAEIWKKVIRVISHELNNSLAPISSLAHSGLQVARMAKESERLEPIYDSIRERVEHLTSFLEGYARFARLPAPKRELVNWREWLEGPRRMYAFDLVGDVPTAAGYFDASQLEQVLINLLKNAREASDDDDGIVVRVDPLPSGGTRVQVLDRGRGISEPVMQRALLPFYSTKPSGGGVGLPLCREIIEAHGGSLRIQGREDGGAEVSFWLPPPP